MPTLDTLHAHGFVYSRSCQCSGFYTEKFVRYPYTVDWRKKRYKARILEGRQPITDWFSTDQLETKLNEIKVNTESV